MQAMAERNTDTGVLRNLLRRLTATAEVRLRVGVVRAVVRVGLGRGRDVASGDMRMSVAVYWLGRVRACARYDWGRVIGVRWGP